MARRTKGQTEPDGTVETCATCRYMLPADGHYSDRGICRRNPPSVVGASPLVEGVGMTVFPLVELDAWCGEWKAA